MPRIARAVATGLPHHITQRGNRRTDVFLDDEDRELYLLFLRKYREQHDLEVLAYCLMSNHVHLIAIPNEPHSLARTLASAHMRYAQHFNWKYSQSGHLWQGRFYSCALDESHTLAATRYVEYNPVRAGFAGLPWVYKWSSARAHIGETRDKLLSKIWPPQDLASEWREFLMHPEDKEKIEEIRASTRRGRPLGSSDFVATLERLLGRNLTARKRGRPRKRS